MNSIDRLVTELCPDGVEHKTLGDVGEFIRGTGLQKKDLSDNEGVPAIHYGQIHTTYGVSTSKTISFTSPDIAARLRHACPGDLLIATTSEDDEAVAKATAWLGDTEVVLSGDAFIYRHQLEPRYVSYFFQSQHFQAQKRRYISGAKVRRISGVSLTKILIPTPPLEIQQEIANILDTFSALEADLETELEDELLARNQQYEYYQQLIFDQVMSNGAKSVPLAEVGQWYGGGTPSKANKGFWTNGSIPWISPKDMRATTLTETEDYITESAVVNSSTKLVPANAVAIVTRSSILEHTLPVAFVPIESTLNQDLKAVIAADGILPRYLFHVFRASRASMLHTVRRIGGSVASLDSKKLWKFEVPIPNLDAQERVIKFFDRFDALVSDLLVDLPAEIQARRQQYEYYRDKLLTFKELEAAS